MDALIRAPLAADLPHLTEMGHAFFIEAGHEKKYTFCPASFERTIAILSQAKLFVVLQKDGQPIGMGAADVGPAFWNNAVKIGREAFFYIQPAHRKGLGKQMIAALEAVSMAYGATVFDVVAEEGSRSEALARLYRAGGYEPAERTFRKALG